LKGKALLEDQKKKAACPPKKPKTMLRAWKGLWPWKGKGRGTERADELQEGKLANGHYGQKLSQKRNRDRETRADKLGEHVANEGGSTDSAPIKRRPAISKAQAVKRKLVTTRNQEFEEVGSTSSWEAKNSSGRGKGGRKSTFDSNNQRGASKGKGEIEILPVKNPGPPGCATSGIKVKKREWRLK